MRVYLTALTKEFFFLLNLFFFCTTALQVGGEILFATDDWFAVAENLLKASLMDDFPHDTEYWKLLLKTGETSRASCKI